jgi:hypothetical protein
MMGKTTIMTSDPRDWHGALLLILFRKKWKQPIWLEMQTHLETSQKLELEGLSLSHGRETAVVNALSEHLHAALGKTKALLNS